MKTLWLMLMTFAGVCIVLAVPGGGDRPSTTDCHYVEDKHLAYIHDLEQKLYRGEAIGSAQDVRPKNLMQQLLLVLHDSYPEQDHRTQCQQLQHVFSPQFRLTLQPGNIIARGALDACVSWLAHHADHRQQGTVQTMVMQEWPMLVVRQQHKTNADMLFVTMENLEEPRITEVTEYNVRV
jgi:hypothetical protein